ncbi:MAG: FAD-binding protein [Acidimicrobiia bacterium]|nr:FAD-binding protein [Acidimicrobiia bacterium]
MTSAGIPYEHAVEAWRAAAPAPPRSLDVPAADVLAAHHPDHQAHGTTTLRVGANAGDRCPSVLADLLESASLVDDVDIAGTAVADTDVVVVGGGGAGCAAALTAADQGARVLVLNKLRLGDSNTVMAEGGIQAAVAPEDSLQRHFADTVRAGHLAGSRDLVAAMVHDGPDVIRWLIQLGVTFDTVAGDAGEVLMARGRAGGTTVPRILSCRDHTGLEIMRSLREAVALHPGIVVRDHAPVVELLTDTHGRCTGAVVVDLVSNAVQLVRANAVLLTTGGAGRLYVGSFPSSNHYGATADGLVLAYRAGARLVDVDSFQYHPTGLAWPSALVGQLITEAARGAGALLVNGHGERFVDEVAPRDVVAAAMLREMADGRAVERDGQVGLLLDVPSLVADQPEILTDRLVTLAKLAARAGVDPTAEPLMVRPTLHYQNGGVVIDEHGATGVAGLWCAGEVAGGIHGRNRVMGNALLDILAFGRRAGRAAAHAAGERIRRPVGLHHLQQWQRGLVDAGLPLDRRAPLLFPPESNVTPDDVMARCR